MKNVYSILFTVNGFEKSKEEISDVDAILNEESNLSKKILNKLDNIEYAPKKSSVDKVLAFLKNSK